MTHLFLKIERCVILPLLNSIVSTAPICRFFFTVHVKTMNDSSEHITMYFQIICFYRRNWVGASMMQHSYCQTSTVTSAGTGQMIYFYKCLDLFETSIKYWSSCENQTKWAVFSFIYLFSHLTYEKDQYLKSLTPMIFYPYGLCYRSKYITYHYTISHKW